MQNPNPVDTICGLLTCLVAAGMLLVFIQIIRNSRTKTETEIGRRTLYSETCGGRFDYWNFTFPFVRVSIYEGLLTINYTNQIVLTAADIDAIRFERFFSLREGVRIVHHKRDVPQFILLWSFEPFRLKYRIEKHLRLRDSSDYGKKLEKKSVTGKKEFWPWLNG